MTHKIVGKAIDERNWLRSEIEEYCQKPMIDDIVLMSDSLGNTVYRVGGGYGNHPMTLYAIEQDALNDLNEVEDFHQSVGWMGRE